MSIQRETETASSVAAGIGLFTLSILLLSCMDAMIKWLSAGYPTIQILFFRMTFALIPITVIIVRSGGLRSLATRRPFMHLTRGLVGFGAAFSFFTAFANMPLADAYAIAFAAPLIITAISVPLLGESVGWRRWSAVAVGFAGVLVILRPGGESSTLLGFGAGMALLGTILYSLTFVLIRRMVDTETNAAILTWQALTAMAISSLFMPWYFVMPTLGDMLLLVFVGMIGGCATLAMTQSFRLAQVSILAPFEYTAMLWGVIFGLTIWGDIPDQWVWIGTAIIVSSGLYILHRETRRKQSAEPLMSARTVSSRPPATGPNAD